MYICSNNNCWFTNVGEAFIDLGLKSLVENVVKKTEGVQYGCLSPMTRFYLPENARDRAMLNGEFFRPDLFLLAGMYATGSTFSEMDIFSTFDYAKEIVKKGSRIGFVGLGGANYCTKERDDVLKGLEELQPLFIVTRDQKTYDLYKDYFECKKGLDCAFWLNDDYAPKGISCKEYIVSTFNRSDEPKDIERLDDVIHPWHMQYYLDESKTRYLSKKNLFVSDSPYEYLTLYANAKEVYTDLVHATIPSLLYQTPVKYFRFDGRSDAFEHIEYVYVDSKGFLRLDPSLLEKEKREIEEYIREKVKNIM